MKMNLRTVVVAASLIAALALHAPAEAQDAVDIAAAKKEGKLVWYTSTPVAQAQKIAGAFEKVMTPGRWVERRRASRRRRAATARSWRPSSRTRSTR